MEFHLRCDDEGCNRRCRRPGCLEPGVHLGARCVRQNRQWVAFHELWDCTVPASDFAVAGLARQAIEEFHPGLGPSDVAAARAVIRQALDLLEQKQRERERWTPQVMESKSA